MLLLHRVVHAALGSESSEHLAAQFRLIFGSHGSQIAVHIVSHTVPDMIVRSKQQACRQ